MLHLDPTAPCISEAEQMCNVARSSLLHRAQPKRLLPRVQFGCCKHTASDSSAAASGETAKIRCHPEYNIKRAKTPAMLARVPNAPD